LLEPLPRFGPLRSAAALPWCGIPRGLAELPSLISEIDNVGVAVIVRPDPIRRRNGLLPASRLSRAMPPTLFFHAGPSGGVPPVRGVRGDGMHW